MIAACHSPKRLRSTLKITLNRNAARTCAFEWLKRSELKPQSLESLAARALSLVLLISQGRTVQRLTFRTSVVHNTASPETFGTGPLIR